jgi:hypothetical protein
MLTILDRLPERWYRIIAPVVGYCVYVPLLLVSCAALALLDRLTRGAKYV